MILAFGALACSLHLKTEGLRLTNNFDDFDDFNNQGTHHNRHARLHHATANTIDDPLSKERESHISEYSAVPRNVPRLKAHTSSYDRTLQRFTKKSTQTGKTYDVNQQRCRQ